MTYNFCINDFEGPLDLLLHLIRCSKMDIYEINIESITKQYLDFINTTKNLSMDIASEYLVMAAELIHLKSRLLLNRKDETEDAEYELNSAEDLRDKLLEYQKVKELTREFRELEEIRGEVYTKIPSDLHEYRNETVLPGDVSIDDLVAAFNLFLERQKLSRPLNTKITKKELSVAERTNDIRRLLKTVHRCGFSELFTTITKPFVVVTFLSILEMAKNREINITQEHSFDDIMIEMK